MLGIKEETKNRVDLSSSSEIPIARKIKGFDIFSVITQVAKV